MPERFKDCARGLAVHTNGLEQLVVGQGLFFEPLSCAGPRVRPGRWRASVCAYGGEGLGCLSRRSPPLASLFLRRMQACLPGRGRARPKVSASCILDL